jgi:hypothetical protein
MTTLVRRNEHLGLHRRMILSRSLAAGVVGLTPVPYLDDWLQAVVRRETIRRIAEARRVDLDEPAVRVIAEGLVPPPGWRQVIGSTPFARLFRRAWRTILMALAIYRRGEDAARGFAEATLFDHYCARIHVGGALDAEAARAVRARIEAAIQKAPTSLSAHIFRRALGGAARAAARAPIQLANALTGGRLRRRLGAGDEAVAEEMAEEMAEEAMRDRGFFQRASQAVDREIAPWVDGLVGAFEDAPPPPWPPGKP